MNQDYVVKPEGFSSQFLTLVQNLDLPDAEKATLLESQLGEIMLSVKPARIFIRLDTRQLLGAEGLERLRTELTRSFQGQEIPQVIWDIHYTAGISTPEYYFQHHWNDFLGVYSQQVNMAQAYLSLVRFKNGDGKRIRISLPNEMSMVALTRQSGDKILSQLLSERLGQEVVVKFEIGEFTEELQHREALYKKRIREELERMMNEKEEETAAKSESAKPGEIRRQVWKMVLGRKVAASPIPIAGINEEQSDVVLEGEIISFECKQLRTGRQLVLMDVYDKTGTMNARLFLDAGKQFSPEVKLGVYVRVRGDVQFDKYSQDLCLLLKDISLGEKIQRKDTALEKRVELHAHTQMSAMDALVSVSQLVARAAEFGHPAIAITDHGVVQGFPDAMAASQKHNIKVLYGMEGYLIEDAWLNMVGSEKPPRPYHFSVLVCKPEGIKNLYRMVSHAHLNYYYRHPRIPRSELMKNRAGLLLGSACEQGELFQKMLGGATESELEAIASSYDYLEIMPRANNQFLIREGRVKDELQMLALNKRIVELGKKVNRPVVATGDVHILEPGDEIFRSILQSGMGYEDAALQAPLYLHTTDEMLQEFAYLGEAVAREVVIQAPQQIANLVEKIVPLKLNFFPPKLPHAEAELKEMAFTRARELYGEKLPEIVEKRLAREIHGINDNGFASLFMIARKLVKKSISDGYLVGSRGSVGSSLTATMLGITEVNPLPGHYLCPGCKCFELPGDGRIGADLPEKECPVCNSLMSKEGFDIPFEVFMGFKGNKLPDIDLNFSGEYQSIAHKYLEEIFDRDHIFRAGTISTVADRIAYGFVKKYLEEFKLVLREAEVNRLTRGCAGVKKTTGQHPGGIMIVPQDMEIYDFTPVQRPADDKESGIITTHLDYHAIHDALLKLDILGHDDPTSLKRLGDWTGLDVRSIPLDDPTTLKIFSSVESLGITSEVIQTSVGTLGIPEFGTEFVRQMLEATRPTQFAELVRISGLSHGTDVWLNNAADLIKSQTATLSTVISVRDDIMNYLIIKKIDPAVSFDIMESVRKGKGLTSEQEKVMRDNQVPQWYVDSCKKIKYMFPKAHAVAYCVMAFRIAYFKVHFPAAFYANYFSLNAECFDAELIVQGGLAGVEEKIKEYRTRQDITTKEKNNLVILEVVREAFHRGIRIRPVSLGESDPTVFKLVTNQELLPPLVSLNGLGLTCALRIAEERVLKPFRSIEDLSRRTGANKNVVEIMTQHHCLGILPKNDQTSLF